MQETEKLPGLSLKPKKTKNKQPANQKYSPQVATITVGFIFLPVSILILWDKGAHWGLVVSSILDKEAHK